MSVRLFANQVSAETVSREKGGGEETSSAPEARIKGAKFKF